MRRLLLLSALVLSLAPASGCIVPIYSADPAMRTQELIFTSEGLRQILKKSALHLQTFTLFAEGLGLLSVEEGRREHLALELRRHEGRDHQVALGN